MHVHPATLGPWYLQLGQPNPWNVERLLASTWASPSTPRATQLGHDPWVAGSLGLCAYGGYPRWGLPDSSDKIPRYLRIRRTPLLSRIRSYIRDKLFDSDSKIQQNSCISISLFRIRSEFIQSNRLSGTIRSVCTPTSMVTTCFSHHPVISHLG